MIINNRGNTIIEVLIATLVIGTVMTAIAIGMTYSIKNTSEAQYREVATTLASEPIEVLRYLRASTNWSAFSASLSQGTFYINETVFTDTTDLTASITPVTLNNMQYFRKVIITKNPADPNKITVQSVVEWSRNGTITSDVTLEQNFFNTQPR